MKRLFIQLRKLWFAVIHPRCWRALSKGVAPAIEHVEILRKADCSLFLDVGANRGQFSLLCRVIKPQVPVIAFEPIPSEIAVFRDAHGQDSGVTLKESALGETAGEAVIHLSRSRDSSSLLPIGDVQTRMFPNTEEVGVLKVSVVRLDDLGSNWREADRIFLKLDVQGFELSVLRGATETLKRCSNVYVECSHEPLYVGQALYDEVALLLGRAGFDPVRRMNESHLNGRLVQADYLFERR